MSKGKISFSSSRVLFEKRRGGRIGYNHKNLSGNFLKLDVEFQILDTTWLAKMRKWKKNKGIWNVELKENVKEIIWGVRTFGPSCKRAQKKEQPNKLTCIYKDDWFLSENGCNMMMICGSWLWVLGRRFPLFPEEILTKQGNVFIPCRALFHLDLTRKLPLQMQRKSKSFENISPLYQDMKGFLDF